MKVSDENLRGRIVLAADGQAIGKVASMLIDVVTWRIESIRVELRKDVADRLGAKRSLFRAGELELSVTLIQSVGDAVILSAPVDELRDMPPQPVVEPLRPQLPA